MTDRNDNTLPEIPDAFEQAVEQHRLMLAVYGEDDPHTVEAMLAVMALAPDDVFEAIEEMARSTFH